MLTIVLNIFTNHVFKDFISNCADEFDIDESQVESQKEVIMRPLSIIEGTETMEFECAINVIAGGYASTFKSESKLRDRLRRLTTLRRVFLPQLMAKNTHYLGRWRRAISWTLLKYICKPVWPEQISVVSTTG